MLKRKAAIFIIISFNLIAITLVLRGTAQFAAATALKDGLKERGQTATTELTQLNKHDSVASNWIIERVDAPKIFGEMRDRSLALDKSGNPHIAYGKDHLYYAWHNGTNWQQEKVDDSPGVGWYTSIAVDKSGNPHISYYDSINGTLKYAHMSGGSWEIQVIDSHTYLTMGKYTSLALDSNGNPHISYTAQFSTGGVKYASWTGSIWAIETVDTDGRTGISLALDSLDVAHLSYMDKGDQLKYAHNSERSWTIKSVDTPGSSGNNTSLSLDSNGDPHISYQGDFNLKYAHWTGSVWNIQTIAEVVNDFSSIGVDSSDDPHIIYSGLGLNYASWTGSGWAIESIEFVLNYNSYPSLVLDSNDIPHVSYFYADGNYNPGELRFAHKKEGDWSVQMVDRAGNVGEFTSLALDENGGLHISYLDDFNLAGDLKYAFWNGNEWTFESVDTFMSYQPTSLALDNQGNPHIAYSYHVSGFGPKYAYKSGGTWISETIDTSGWGVSLALDSQDEPHISYHHLFEENLKYAHWTGSEWDIQVIESIGMWGGGRETSIAIDSHDTPHISYYVWDEQTLKYAHLEAGNWISETVDTFGGRFSSLWLDSQDHPHISYQGDGTKLKYAYWTGSGWISETVDADFGLGWYTSLELDSAENPHISYHKIDDRDLKYAHKTGGVWEIEIVDSVGEVGDFTSMAIGDEGQIYISYYDLTNDDLKLAYRGAINFPTQSIFLPVILRDQ